MRGGSCGAAGCDQQQDARNEQVAWGALAVEAAHDRDQAADPSRPWRWLGPAPRARGWAGRTGREAGGCRGATGSRPAPGPQWIRSCEWARAHLDPRRGPSDTCVHGSRNEVGGAKRPCGCVGAYPWMKQRQRRPPGWRACLGAAENPTRSPVIKAGASAMRVKPVSAPRGAWPTDRR